jgi:predicted nucleic-acid-binding protein
MIGIDTNVLVRFIVRDDPEQASIATAFIESLSVDNPAFLTLVTVAELYWVLDHTYKASREQIYNIFHSLLTSEDLVIEDAELVQEALRRYSQSNADFDDCLISSCSVAGGCESIVTFDKQAAKLLGMTLLA